MAAAPNEPQCLGHERVGERLDVARALHDQVLRLFAGGGHEDREQFHHVGGDEVREARQRRPEAIDELIERGLERLGGLDLEHRGGGREEPVLHDAIDPVAAEAHPILAPAGV